jgi:hypothetical protein
MPHLRRESTYCDDVIDEAERIRRGAAMLDRAKARLTETAGRRDGSNAASVAWEDASIAFHRAHALLYSDAFWERIGVIGNGEDGPVEDALTFLEVDPWCFRSGYAKETILRRLKRVTFSAEQAVRLRAVVLHTIEVGDRREFRGYCRLAPKVADPAFRGAVLARLRSKDRGVARRALWALDAMAEPLDPDDRAIAQQILETGARATTQDWWRVARWVRVLTARYADPAWIARVVGLAVNGGPDQVAGLRLLPAMPNDPPGQDRQVLASLVLRVIDEGGDESFLESTAVLADSPAFREALSNVYRSAVDREVRRRAWWAINAIRRFGDRGWPESERET